MAVVLGLKANALYMIRKYSSTEIYSKAFKRTNHLWTIAFYNNDLGGI